MDKNKYMMGVDLGTTSTKAVLYRETGEVVASENVENRLYTPDADTAEQDPEAIFQSVLRSVGQVMKKSGIDPKDLRSEEHTSELQSRENLVCRLLLEKKKKRIK